MLVSSVRPQPRNSVFWEQPLVPRNHAVGRSKGPPSLSFLRVGDPWLLVALSFTVGRSFPRNPAPQSNHRTMNCHSEERKISSPQRVSPAHLTPGDPPTHKSKNLCIHLRIFSPPVISPRITQKFPCFTQICPPNQTNAQNFESAGTCTLARHRRGLLFLGHAHGLDTPTWSSSGESAPPARRSDSPR